MALKFRKKTLLAKIEPIYGTDSVPTGAANAIEVVDLTIQPMAGTRAVHRVERATLGNFLQTLVGAHVIVSFKVAVAGSSALGVAPGYGVLLRGSAHSETISAGVSVAYAPVSSGEESVTMYVNIDGTLHKMLGCRGMMSGISFDSSGYPYYNFQFFGLFSDPVAGALPAVTLTGFKKPVVFNNANSSVSLLGQSPNVKSLNISSGQQVRYRNVVGSESVVVTDRQPAGSVSFEAVPIGTFDYFAAVKNQTLGVMTVTHGPAANQVVVNCPSVQLSDIGYSNDDDILMMDVPLSILPTAGDDDYSITVK